MRKSQISPDTIANILRADKVLGHVSTVLKRNRVKADQEIAELDWARVLLENVVRGLRKIKGE